MGVYKSKFIEIDPENCSKEELHTAIEKMSDLSGYYETKQLAIKTFINSVYGATASKYFVGYNVNVAESITLQGQDLNHYSENCVNKYFRGIFQSDAEYNKIIYVPIFEWMEKWDLNSTDEFYAQNPSNSEWTLIKLPVSKDELKAGVKDLQILNMIKKNVYVKTTFGQYLGITLEQAKSIDINRGRITAQKPLNHKDFTDKFQYLGNATYLEDDPTCSLVIAGDTDSVYVEFGRISNQLGIYNINKATRFVVDLWNYGCGPYMDDCYDKYAKKYNCDKNLQVLELEKIADTAIMVAKKHYAMSECFLEPNIYVTPGEHVLYKGLELIQGSTPIFARQCQDDFTRYILKWYETHTTAPEFNTLLSMVKKYKDDFMKQPPDNISKAASIGDYEKFIVDDNKEFAIGLHCPIHVKAAGIHNYMLNMARNKKYKMKYNKIKTRDKVKFYKTKDPIYDVFGFIPGKFPIEFAPEIDYNKQFEDLVLGPINRIIEILGYQTLTPDLCFTTALF